MGNFNRGDRGGFGGKKRPGGDRGFNQGERELPLMHRAICSECGRPCEVPFRPSGDKPVFCSDCFGRRESHPSPGLRQASTGDNRHERRDSFRREQRRETNEFSFDEKPMFHAVCDKCHRECEVPFKPNGDKPVFCSDCFVRGEKGGANNAVNQDANKKQFETINSKLDYILKLLSTKDSGAKPAKETKADLPVIKKEERQVETKKELTPKKEITVKKEKAQKKEAPKKEVAPKKASKKATAKKK